METLLPEPNSCQLPSNLPFRKPFGYELSHDCDERIFLERTPSWLLALNLRVVRSFVFVSVRFDASISGAIGL